MTQLKELQPVTLAEFETMEKQEGWNYELIDGVVMMSPRPAVGHQRIMGLLYMELFTALQSKNCEPFLEIDLTLDGNHFVPDILIDCNNLEDTDKRSERPPIIIVEIVSPTSTSRDYFTKRLKYEQLGIQEYWIVSPEDKCIMVISFATGTQEMYCTGTVQSAIMPELKINLNKIFK